MPAKRIRISTHAAFEMRRRGIRRSEVIRAILDPGQILSSSKGREVYQRLIGPRGRVLLGAVVKQAANVYPVLTAYKTSKVAKYWRTP
jgi:hypothetical protein